jgi:hypothetical protein
MNDLPPKVHSRTAFNQRNIDQTLRRLANQPSDRGHGACGNPNTGGMIAPGRATPGLLPLRAFRRAVRFEGNDTLAIVQKTAPNGPIANPTTFKLTRLE